VSASAYLVAGALGILLVVIGGWAVAPAGADASSIHVLSRVFGAPGSGPGQLSHPVGVAVEEVALGFQGDVYVVDTGNNRVEWFGPEGAFKGQFDGHETPAGSFLLPPPNAVAIDNSTNPLDPSRGDVYVLDSGHRVIDKFGPAGNYLGTIDRGPGGVVFEEALWGIAVDQEGHLWVNPFGTKTNNAEVYEYSSEESSQFLAVVNTAGSGHGGGGERNGGFALDGKRDFFFTGFIEVTETNATGEALISAIRSVEKGLSGDVTEYTASGSAVDQASGDLYIDNNHEIRGFTPSEQCTAKEPCTEPPPASLRETFGQFALQQGAGVAVTKQGVVYVADAGANRVKAFSPVSVPAVEAQTVETVGVTEATASAEISPLGVPTTYRVEYGTGNTYGSATAAVELGSSSGFVRVTARLTGLTPGTPYHFRFAATSEAGTGYGLDGTLHTRPSVIVGLPDSRVYELVSSPTANTDVYPPFGIFSPPNNTRLLMRAAADGHGVVYVGDPPPEGGNGSTGTNSGNGYLATRNADGWTQRPITPFTGFHFEGFSSDLSTGVFDPEFGGTASFEANPSSPGNCTRLPMFTYTPGDAAYHSLLTSVPSSSPTVCSGEFAGGNAGTAAVAPYSHVLFQSPAKLAPEATLELVLKSENFRYNLYHSYAGQTRLVSVLPNGEPSVNARFVGVPPSEVNELNTDESDGEADSSQQGTPDDISADGSRVFWAQMTDGRKETERQLYVRENPDQPQSPLAEGKCTDPRDACTLQLDVAQPGAPGASGGGIFRAASVDGSKVFFTDESRLTTDSTAKPGEPNLYEYLLSPETGKPGAVIDLTAVEHANVKGVAGPSADGEYVYFVAVGVLTEGANAEGSEPTPGQPNLYLHHAGRTTFVATLAIRDGSEHLTPNEERVGDWLSDPGLRSAQATPDGQSLVFRSTQPLTGYESAGVPEVFVYNARAQSISCSSCDPAGLAPSKDLRDADAPQVYRAGGFIRPSTNSDFMRRSISEDGSRVFFETGQALVPQDTNGQLDVYEWERPATAAEPTNTCTPASSTFSELNGGCVYLLSGGTSSDDAYFLDASANGNDVFFLSRGKLTAGSLNENMALYDARVNGGFPEPKLACTGTGCQGVPPGAPTFATPSSATFNGIGNFTPAPPAQNPKSVAQKRAEQLARALRACRSKHNRRKRARCEAATRKRYAPARTARKKLSHATRGGR
jgi:hypothetical protein